MALTLGTLVGQYRITGYLGDGHSTKVFKAYQDTLDRHVILKVLRSRHDSATYDRFKLEAQLAARLDHPNILPTLDFGDDPKAYTYLVYRWVDGEPLRNRLRSGALPVAEVARILGGLGAALTYTHQRSILHRDLRPSNVLLDKNSNVYLADFALPPLTEGGTAMLGAGDISLSAPEYASPEQARGEELESYSDQYSLGVLAFEMLTGNLPFWAESPEEVLHHHVSTQPTRPSMINSALSTAVDEVVLRALAKKPKQRYDTIAGFVGAFQQAVAPPRPATAPLPPVDTLSPEAAEAARRTLMLQLQSGYAFNLQGRSRYWLGRSEPTRPFSPEVDMAAHRGIELGVSRQHGTLHFERGRWYYTDMRSSNGSRINGARLYSEIPVELKDGDEICLGKLVLRIYFGE